MDTNLPAAAAQSVGLFPLQLRSQPEAGQMGAPVLHLELLVASAQEQVNGLALVTQPLPQPVVCKSYVSGPVMVMTVMDPVRTRIRFDLVGHRYDLPPGSEIDNPVNFRAIVVLDEDYSKGMVEYQFGYPVPGAMITQAIIRVD